MLLATEKHIKVRDKNFKPFIKEEVIMARIKELALEVETDFKHKNPVFMIVLTGSFMFASDFLKCINFPCEISFMRAKSYKGTESTGEVELIFTHSHDLKKGREVVIIEDIVDSGVTINVINAYFKEKKCKPTTVALLWKPMKSDYVPEYYAFKSPDNFIVGYGLDYNEEGRNLKHLYTEDKI